jgi:hypothetical protein
MYRSESDYASQQGLQRRKQKKRNLYSLSLQVFLLHALFFRLFVRTDEVPGDKDVTDYFIAQLVPYMHGFESFDIAPSCKTGSESWFNVTVHVTVFITTVVCFRRKKTTTVVSSID